MANKKNTEKVGVSKSTKHDAKKTTGSRADCCKNVEAAQDNCRLSDYDIISDVLGGHKNLVKLYGTALCETDSEQLRKLINAQMSECAVDQFDAFKYMNDRGMYKVEPAPVQKVKSARTKYCKCIEKFSCGCGDKQ